MILGLLLIFSAYTTVTSFGEESKDKAREAKDKVKEERKDSKDKAKPDVNQVDMIGKFLSDLEHRASRLQKAAEEQSNHEALAVIEQAMDLIRNAKQMISEENQERAKALLREANELLNKAERMLNGGSDTNTSPYVNHADMIEKFASDLEHRASLLQKVAEDQGNNEALALIQQAIDLIMKAKQMISEENYEGAKPLLGEANDLLFKAERMLNGGSDTNEGPYNNPALGNEVDYTSKIEKFVSDLEHRADRLKKEAEDHDNNEALEVIQQAIDLIMKAKQMVSEKSYEEAKPLLREANDLLIKAETMLKGSSDANPVPGQEEQGTYHPQKPPVYGDRPGIAPIISLAGTGTATEAGEGETTDVFAELDLSVFRATPRMLLVRVTDGFLAIGDTIYTVDQGKAVISMKAHKMILTARVSSDDGTDTQKLKLFGTMENSSPDNMDNPPEQGNNPAPGIQTITLRGKLAHWLINMDAELT